MKEIRPNFLEDFQIAIPGSKSITNRVLLLAAMADGESVLTNVLSSDDADYMKKALEELGVSYQVLGDSGDELKVLGCGGKLEVPGGELFLGNAGTATRFLTAALSTCDFEVIVTGNERMKERPIAPLLDALSQLGVECVDLKGTGCPPIKLKGPMKGGKAVVPGNLSSQYFSALLMAAPYAQGDVVIEVEGDLVSKPYVDITFKCMETFGVVAENENYQKFRIKSGQRYLAQNYLIEGDASGATYFLGIGALKGVKAEITNVPLDAIQGDVQFLEVLQQMGVEIGGATSGADGGGNIWARGEVDDNRLPQIKALGEVDLNHIPDAAMTVAVLAAFADGVTEIVNVDNLRIKETDRIAALVTELKKIGVEAEELPTGIRIVGRGPAALYGADIDTYDDHRMAMCFGMAGTVVPGIKIEDPGCVAKTYPDFWEDLSGIGISFAD